MQQRCHISHEHFSGGDAEVSSCFDLIFSRYSPDMSKRSSDKYVWPPRNMCLHSTYWVPPPSRSPKQKNITLKKTSSGPEPPHKKKMIKILCIKKPKKKLLYFEWSPPWHVGWRLSGEGCHWEYNGKNGEFENIDFRFPWLSDTSEMGFGHDVPFLNYSDRLPHPSDLCQPDRVRRG